MWRINEKLIHIFFIIHDAKKSIDSFIVICSVGSWLFLSNLKKCGDFLILIWAGFQFQKCDQ